MVLSFECVDEILKCDIEMFSTDLTMLCKAALTFTSMDKILKCDHSNAIILSYYAALSCGAVYCAVQGGSNFLRLKMKS